LSRKGKRIIPDRKQKCRDLRKLFLLAPGRGDRRDGRHGLTLDEKRPGPGLPTKKAG
jgi:hypothetical protein